MSIKESKFSFRSFNSIIKLVNFKVTLDSYKYNFPKERSLFGLKLQRML